MSKTIEQQIKAMKRAIVVGAFFSTEDRQACEESLEELSRLCTTYGLETVARVACPLKKIDPATYIGKGKLEELCALADSEDGDVLIFDDEIAPKQQKNLEGVLKKPVLDRTELIIEVFAQRAKTKEARLQIELAKVKYQMPRLKRLWTHLSRQSGTAGSSGYLKGEGEKQIEIDRRLLKKRVDQLNAEIEDVREKRQTQRTLRKRTAVPTFAIVGYTNAGKSTLLKALTNADVLVEDKLFATLDTTTRKYLLPNNQEILLVDTVGFIRKIPHTLVMAFKSTLEEAIYTDVILHLIDASNPAAELQADATLKVLKELGAEDRPMITILNKVDALESRFPLIKLKVKYPKSVPISAVAGEGFDLLMEEMEKAVASLRKTLKLRIPQSQYGLVSQLMQEGRVIDCSYEDNDVLLQAEVPVKYLAKVEEFIDEPTRIASD